MLVHTTGILLIMCWVFLPRTYGPRLTATNLQWVAGVSLLLIFCLPDRQLERHPVVFTIWALVCGLSGIPGILVTPLFFIPQSLHFDFRHWSRASRCNVGTIGFHLYEWDVRPAI
jgi:hypothetical protein